MYELYFDQEVQNMMYRSSLPLVWWKYCKRCHELISIRYI